MPSSLVIVIELSMAFHIDNIRNIFHNSTDIYVILSGLFLRKKQKKKEKTKFP